jgi:hypothetical protein
VAKVSPIQQSFNAGELSPLMYARSDVAKYKNGLATCKNAKPLVQGGWACREGTYYVAPTKANGVARLQRFEFSTTQAYMLEFGNLYARFYKDHGAILATAQDITAVTKADPAVLTYSGSDTFTAGDEVEISGVGGMTELNGRRFKVGTVDTGANTFQLLDVDGTNIDSTGYTTYTSGGSVAEVYTLTTTYVVADVFDLKMAQSADTVYIAHPSYPPRKMTRTAHNAWTITTITFLDGPYLVTNATATTLTLSGTSGSVTVTASAVTGINSDAGFASTDVGRLIRWKDPAGNWTWLTITAWTSTTQVTATISGPNASATTATVNWRLGVWSDTTGYPGAVCFNEDRLCFGGATQYPQRVDMSNSGDYENFAPSAAGGTVGDANAISVTLNASDVNVIRWMQDDEKGLLIGTVGGEWIVRAATLSEAMSPTNIAAKRSTTYGSANIQPVRAGKGTLYVQRSGRKLRELAYIFESDGFRAPDMTVLSEHITLGGLIQLAYQQETQSIIWAPRDDGTLIGFTYEREQEVLGWHRHTLGGYYDSGHLVAAKVESVQCIPAPDGTRDEWWAITNRYINGATRRYVEFGTKAYERGDLQADVVLVDSALTLNNTVAQTLTPGAGATTQFTEDVIFTAGGAVFASTDVGRYIHYDYTDSNGVARRASARITAYTDTTHVKATINYPWPSLTLIASAGWRMSVTTITGLWHLEGETVSILADGAVHPDATVEEGSITLTYPASKAQVGLAYNSDLEMLRIDAGAADGTAQGKKRRINKLVVRFHDTVGAKIGPSFDNLTPISFRTGASDTSVAVPFFSGDKEVTWDGNYDREGRVCIRRDQPTPMTVLATMPQMTTQDG